MADSKEFTCHIYIYIFLTYSSPSYKGELQESFSFSKHVKIYTMLKQETL